MLMFPAAPTIDSHEQTEDDLSRLTKQTAQCVSHPAHLPSRLPARIRRHSATALEQMSLNRYVGQKPSFGTEADNAYREHALGETLIAHYDSVD